MFTLIGAASGWGAQIRACEEGPEVLKEKHLLEKLREAKISVSDFRMLYPKKRVHDGHISLPESFPLIHDLNLRLAKEVERSLKAGEFPVILGGDHSIAVGTWNGVYQFIQKPMGLIWIDAHMDAHTKETSPSGAWHGMPLAGLLGHGELREQTVLLPENLCLIGTRSFEEGEAEFLRRLNVRIFFMEEVKERGMQAVMKEAIQHVSRHTKGFGVSLDLDVITPEEAPGVGSPEEGGISTKELLQALSLLQSEKAFTAFELVEYNPQRDPLGKTANICFDILKMVMIPFSLQKNQG